jgi:hypothetical protein
MVSRSHGSLASTGSLSKIPNTPRTRQGSLFFHARFAVGTAQTSFGSIEMDVRRDHFIQGQEICEPAPCLPSLQAAAAAAAVAAAAAAAAAACSNSKSRTWGRNGFRTEQHGLSSCVPTTTPCLSGKLFYRLGRHCNHPTCYHDTWNYAGAVPF